MAAQLIDRSLMGIFFFLLFLWQWQEHVQKVFQKQESMEEMFQKRQVSLKKLAAKQTRPVQPVAPRPEAFVKSPCASPGKKLQQPLTNILRYAEKLKETFSCNLWLHKHLCEICSSSNCCLILVCVFRSSKRIRIQLRNQCASEGKLQKRKGNFFSLHFSCTYCLKS